MSAVRTPYNDLGYFINPPTEDGEWTALTGGAPDAPITWDGTVDFTEAAKGVYVYQYTIDDCDAGTITQTVSYEWEPAPERVNDDCDGAKILNLVQPLIDNTGSSCPGLAAPTDSGVAIPTPWGDGSNLTGDLWYFINRSNLVDETITITVEGYSVFGSLGATPYLALYTGDCGSLALVQAASDSNGRVSLSVNKPSATPSYDLWVRVVSPSAEVGQISVGADVSQDTASVVQMLVSESAEFYLQPGRLLDQVVFVGTGVFKVGFSPAAGDLIDDNPGSPPPTYTVDYYSGSGTQLYITGTGLVKLYVK